MGSTAPTTATSKCSSTPAVGPLGAVGLVVDSYGLIALAARQASAAVDLGVVAGDAVTLRPIADRAALDEPVTAVTVQFGRRADPVPPDPVPPDPVPPVQDTLGPDARGSDTPSSQPGGAL